MADVEHNTLHDTANMHAVHRWAAADQAARFALSVTADDIGKVAYQADTSTFWALIDEAEVGNAGGWQELDAVAAIAAAAAAQADATQALSDAGDASSAASAAQSDATQALSDAADAQADADAHGSRHLPGGADEVQPLAAGTNLADGAQTIQWSTTDTYRRMPASTTTGASAKTLGVTNAVAGSAWVLDIYAQGHDVTIVNGGSGAGTIETIAAGAKVRYVVRFDGTNWVKGVRLPLA